QWFPSGNYPTFECLLAFSALLSYRNYCGYKTQVRSVFMKIAVIGANGHIGSRVVQEALNRGHEVTAVVRTPSKVETQHEHLKVVQGDVFDNERIVNAIKGQDVVVSAYNIGYSPDSDPANFPKAAQYLIE